MSRSVVHAEEWQYWIVVSDSETRLPANCGTGLVDVDGPTAIVTTGTGYGPVCIEWHVLARRPDDLKPVPQDELWSEVAEFSVGFEAGELWLFSPFSGPPRDHKLTGHPGTWRIRIHARGRDVAASHSSPLTQPVESHLLLLWQAPMSPVRLLRGTDEVGSRHGRKSRA